MIVSRLNLNNKQLVLWVSLFVGLPLFIYTLTTIDSGEVFFALSRISLGSLGLYVGLSILNLIAYTLIWWNFLRSEPGGNKITAGTLFNYRMAGFAISYITPGPRIGGEITRGGLAGKHHSVTQQAGATTAVMEKFCLFVGGLLFDTTAVICGLIILPENLILQITLGGLIGVGLLMLIGWYGFVARNGDKKIINWLTDQFSFDKNKQSGRVNQIDISTYLQNRRSQTISSVLVSVMTKFIIALQMYVLLAGLQSPITFLQAIFLAAAIDIAYSIPSYMGLGALEAGQTGVLRLVGGSASIGVLVAFFTRIRDILFSGYGLLALAYYTSNEAKTQNNR